MNLYIMCGQCIDDKEDLRFYKVPVNEEGKYSFTCCKGHKIKAITANEKYQILFQMATNALLDGYYFEAVGCFIASVERYREWVIKFIWYINNIDDEITEKLWKQYKNSSERQLGAFYSMYLNQFKVSPPIFDDQQNGFRNSVLHKGIIPTKVQAEDFGEYVFNYIREIQKIIYTQYSQESFKFSVKSENEKKLQLIKEAEILDTKVIHNQSDMILLDIYAVSRNTSFKEELNIVEGYLKEYKKFSPIDE